MITTIGSTKVVDSLSSIVYVFDHFGTFNALWTVRIVPNLFIRLFHDFFEFLQICATFFKFPTFSVYFIKLFRKLCQKIPLSKAISANFSPSPNRFPYKPIFWHQLNTNTRFVLDPSKAASLNISIEIFCQMMK